MLVVAGGRDNIYNYLSSTEKMTNGARRWTFSKSLPRTLAGVASISMDNKIYLTGKCGGVVVLLL